MNSRNACLLDLAQRIMAPLLFSCNYTIRSTTCGLFPEPFSCLSLTLIQPSSAYRHGLPLTNSSPIRRHLQGWFGSDFRKGENSFRICSVTRLRIGMKLRASSDLIGEHERKNFGWNNGPN